MDREDVLIGVLVSSFQLTSLRLTQILDTYPTLEQAFQDKFSKLKNSVWSDTLKVVIDWQPIIEDFSITLAHHRVGIISKFSPFFPHTLFDLKDIPLALFYQGDIKLASQTQLLTVVGSRNYSRYSELALNDILVPVVQAGVVVVSGLAMGIDMISHKIAVDNGQKTIGVIGSGLDDASFFPTANLALKQQIIELGGLVISEYPIGFFATKFSFPRRNRILAALSPVTWIVEANKNSGSLITARDAQKLGRKIITTLAPLFEEQFTGNIDLFRNGSRLITESQDILDEYGVKTATKKAVSKAPIDAQHLAIYQKMDIVGKSIELLAEEIGMSTQQLMGVLTMMEIEGYVENIGQNVWVRK